MNTMTLSDSELVKLYAEGDESALKTLVLRHQQQVFSYILNSVKNRELAEDLFQDTFVKVINTIRSGAYHEEGKFLPWVLRIAYNLKIDYFRRTNRMPLYSGSDDFDVFDMISEQELSVEQKMIQNQVFEDAKSLLHYLPSEQREVLEMRLYDDISFKEIAEKTNVSINTALGRMRYAIINLRKLVEEKNVVLS